MKTFQVALRFEASSDEDAKGMLAALVRAVRAAPVLVGVAWDDLDEVEPTTHTSYAFKRTLVPAAQVGAQPTNSGTEPLGFTR